MSKEANSNWITYFSYSLLFAVGIYIILRAVYVPLYSDEAMTFFIYVKTGGFDPFLSLQSANNHVLNSALMRVSFLLFGDAPFALRLPNVLSYCIFAFYVLKMQKFFKEPLHGLAWLILMVSSHYFISFFHLARGYGMSMAFLLAASYYLFEIGKGAEIKKFLAFCLFLNMAVWSNLSLLVPAIAMFLIAGSDIVIQLQNSEKNKRVLLLFGLTFLLFGLLPFGGAVEIALSLKEAGALYHGTSYGFQEVIINFFLMDLIPEYPFVAQYFFWPFFGVYLLEIIWITRVKRWTKTVFLAQAIFWLTILGTVFMHALLHVNYPLDRAALHFFPFFVLAFITASDRISLRFSLPVTLVAAALFMVQQVSFLNLNRTSHWANENVPLEVLDYLHDWKDSTGKLPVVSAHGLPGRGLVYEVYQDPREPIYPLIDGFPAATADFILTYEWEEHYPEGYVSRLQFPEVKMELLERKIPVDWRLLKRTSPVNIPDTRIGDAICSFEIDGHDFEAISISFKADLACKEGPFEGWISLQVVDTTGKEIAFHYIDLGRTKLPSELNKVHHRLLQGELPSMPLIAILKWMNVRGQMYSLEQIEIDCYGKARIHGE